MKKIVALLSVIFIVCHFSEIKSQELTLPGEESSEPSITEDEESENKVSIEIRGGYSALLGKTYGENEIYEYNSKLRNGFGFKAQYAVVFKKRFQIGLLFSMNIRSTQMNVNEDISYKYNIDASIRSIYDRIRILYTGPSFGYKSYGSKVGSFVAEISLGPIIYTDKSIYGYYPIIFPNDDEDYTFKKVTFGTNLTLGYLFSIGEYAYLGPCIDLQTGSFKLNDVKISASTFNVSLAFDFKF